MTSDASPVIVLVRSWNRPLYLWACLDSLFRSTRYPCRFVLIDNHSTDPQVRDVIAGFERRGMFHGVHFMSKNDVTNQSIVYRMFPAEPGSYLVLIDGDITVEDTEPCWLSRLVDIADRHPQIGALGSIVDQRDFVAPEQVRKIAPELPLDELNDLVKVNSPERRLEASEEEVITPFPPAGRLLLLRSDIFQKTGISAGNLRICKAVETAGYEVGIATTVRHRHLSLVNCFDYPEYDYNQLRRYLRGQ